jgi:hypothetical protein
MFLQGILPHPRLINPLFRLVFSASPFPKNALFISIF